MQNVLVVPTAGFLRGPIGPTYDSNSGRVIDFIFLKLSNNKIMCLAGEPYYKVTRLPLYSLNSFVSLDWDSSCLVNFI